MAENKLHKMVVIGFEGHEVEYTPTMESEGGKKSWKYVETPAVL